MPWGFNLSPLLDSREPSETSQDNEELLRARQARQNGQLSLGIENENEYYASIDLKTKRALPELPEKVGARACTQARRGGHAAPPPPPPARGSMWAVPHSSTRTQAAAPPGLHARPLFALALQAAAALQKLLKAVRAQDIDEVSRLMKLGAPVNEPNPDEDVRAPTGPHPLAHAHAHAAPTGLATHAAPARARQPACPAPRAAQPLPRLQPQPTACPNVR